MFGVTTGLILNRLLNYLPRETIEQAAALAKARTSLPIQNLIRTRRATRQLIRELIQGEGKILFTRQQLPALRHWERMVPKRPEVGMKILQQLEAITGTQLPKKIGPEAYKIVEATGQAARGFRSTVARLHRIYRRLIKSGMKPTEALRRVMKIDQRLAMGTLPALLPQVAQDADLVKKLPRKTRMHIKAVSMLPIISGAASLASMIPAFSKYMSPYISGLSFPATMLLLELHRPYAKMKKYPTILAAIAAGLPIAEAVIRKLTGATRKS